jgi:Right handed beta helix region
LNESWGTVHRRIGLGSLALVLATGALALAAAPASAAPARTLYVATTGNDGNEPANDCTVKTKPCKTIQHAVDEASAGDTVSIAAGTYAESVVITKAVTVTGATGGTTTVSGDQGGGGAVTFQIGGIDGPGPAVTLEHLNISHNAQAPGVWEHSGQVTISDSAVSDDVEFGVLADTGSLTVRDSTIDGNNGGGLIVSSAKATVSDSTVNDNVGTDGTPEGLDLAFGVAVLGPGSAAVTRSTISGNGLAGVYVFAGLVEASAAAAASPSASVTDSTIADSGVFGVANGPGGIATIDNSTISGSHGGGIYTQSSQTDITNSTISGTTKAPAEFPAPAGFTGGVVALPPGVGLPTVAGRSASREVFPAGRQLAIASGSAKVTTASRSAKTPSADAAPIGAPTIINLSGTIVAKQAGVPDCSGLIVDKGYNLSSDTANSCKFSSAEHSLSETDPKLAALADNGGATKTELPKKGSAAIDAIPAGKAGCVADAADQRGVARPQPTGGKCDIGAVELAAKAIVIHPSKLPHGTVGEKYDVTFTATGGQFPSYAWSLAPGSSLPAGLTLSSGGVLSGTPTKVGKSTFTVSVNDPVLKEYTLVIDAAAAPAGGASAPIAATGSPIGQLTTTGGLALLGGLLVLLAAGLIGRRPGRHRVG